MPFRRFFYSVIVIALFFACGSSPAQYEHIYGGDFELPIPEDQEYSKGWMADAIIVVPDHFIIEDLDVAITINHTSAFDLQLYLQSPAGKMICLNMYNPEDEFFEGANYTNTIFDDEASTFINEGTAPFTGRYRPRAPYCLSDFDGQDCYGQWKLRIYDAYQGDRGSLESFELIVTTPEPAGITLFALGFVILRLQRGRKK